MINKELISKAKDKAIERANEEGYGEHDMDKFKIALSMFLAGYLQANRDLDNREDK